MKRKQPMEVEGYEMNSSTLEPQNMDTRWRRRGCVRIKVKNNSGQNEWEKRLAMAETAILKDGI